MAALSTAKICAALAVLAWQFQGFSSQGAVIRVASFNVENYLDAPTPTRHVKSPEAQDKVCQSILALKPDVIALQEMGSTNALLALQARLKDGGLDLPFWSEVGAYDTNIHVAVLSRFPLFERRQHTNESFLSDGRKISMKRGFAELEVDVTTNWNFTLVAAHLKSRVPSREADEEEWRYEEAVILRRAIDERLSANPDDRLIVLGDFNDLIDSKPIRAIVGRGKTALFDTRPAERVNGPDPARRVVWTDYYAKEDLYSRIDYIFASRALKASWLKNETYILNLPDWGLASDHRPIVAGFLAPDR
jgi:endonuclease/exonuclease/phosphatase family metal-dependent hydrolase